MFYISASPHIKSNICTRDIMTDVCISLIPAVLFGVYINGVYAACIVAISVASCVAAEYIFLRIVGHMQGVGVYDMSAVVTGLMLALNMPPYVALYVPVVGAVFAIVIVKQLFGGLGHNFMNPALAARCFLLISFSREMTAFFPDGISGATPLARIATDEYPSLAEMFFGWGGGCIGETSVPALGVGIIYLTAKKIIDIRIPISYIMSFTILLAIYLAVSDEENALYCIQANIYGGGLIFGAFFMATDYVTSPVTGAGRIVYGITAGALTWVFRQFGGLPEGVSYAIICSNMIVPLIEKCTVRKPFGEEKFRWRGNV